MKKMSLFSQVLKIIPRNTFNTLIKKHQTEYRSKGFSSWDHFVSMLFCQMSEAKSLKEIELGLKSCEGNLSHLGINAPAKSTLAYANEHRDWRLFEGLFQQLLQDLRSQITEKSKRIALSNKLYSIDSTTVELCLNTFSWAKYRSTKGALKIHLRLDHDGYIPDFVVVGEGATHDVIPARDFPYETGSITVFDRGYVDYNLFKQIDEGGAFFVTRLKKNACYELVKKLNLPDKHDPDLISDSMIKLNGKSFTNPVRLVLLKDADGKEMRFISNNLELSAQMISDIYRERWNIETFFKHLKQKLKVKTFVGTSKNAVMIQIYTALIAFLLLKFIHAKSSFSWCLSNMVALFRMNLFSYKDLWSWIQNPFPQRYKDPPDMVQ